MNQKGQGALDFLMTYGWTILAVMVSIAAFWQFGLLGGGFMSAITGMNYCVLPVGIICVDHSIGPTGVTIVLKNALPSTITNVVVRIQSRESGITCTQSQSDPQLPINIKNDQTWSFFIPCEGLQNKHRFRGSVIVSYTLEGSVLSHTDEGSIAAGEIEPSQICNVDNDEDTFYQEGSCPTADDCNDNSNAAYPGGPVENTIELCSDDLDNDCNGLTDEQELACRGIGCPPEGPDVDGDTFNNALCPGGNDCNDGDFFINPGRSADKIGGNLTICVDGVDTDCDGLIDLADPNCLGNVLCQNADEDLCFGGECWSNKFICQGDIGPDCDDTPVNQDGCGEFCKPEYLELCEDLNDNDCNDLTEEQEPCSCLPGCDQDGDNSCAENCQGWNGGYDCADNDPTRNPYVNEVCYDGIDNNCNGFTDEFCCGANPGPPECDQDNDTYCSDVKGCDGTDCDDTNPNVNPGVWDEWSSLECTDGIDNDCDEYIDCGESCCNDEPDTTPPGSSPIFSPLFKPWCATNPACGGSN